MEARTSTRGAPLIVLWALLLLESLFGLAMAILLSLVAGEAGGAEESIRFAAGGAFLFAIGALVASIGVRRRRGWSWTFGALLQLFLAIGAGIAVIAAGEAGVTGAHLIGFALAALTMLALSSSQVRRALGQA